MTPGLANKLSSKYAAKICCNFPETVANIPNGKGILTGTPIRKELLSGDKVAGLNLCGFNTEKPVLMIIGGSLGALHVNEAIRRIIPELIRRYQVIHICGKEKIDNLLLTTKGYKQFEYVKSELKDLFAMADLVISRAGANAICELLALKKPNILIPLKAGSRGDQILNANSFKKQGYSEVLEEENMTNDNLLDAINKLYENREKYIETMCSSKLNDSTNIIVDLINKVCK